VHFFFSAFAVMSIFLTGFTGFRVATVGDLLGIGCMKFGVTISRQSPGIYVVRKMMRVCD
jgi:hypothetical protein